MSNKDFIVNRSDLSQTKVQESAALVASAEGEVVFDIERFALTANNITYGVAGDMLGYWHFFPAPESWGRIPVWGIGRVSSSMANGVKAGDQYYGYFPMSNQLKVHASQVSDRGLTDSAANRAALSPVYNQYARVSPGNGFAPGFDNHQMIYRPLFTTSFVLDDYLFDNEFFGATSVIVGSASSKTGFGLAFQLKQREGVRVIGLTSTSNLDFVRSLDLYDEVVAYDNVESLDASVPVAYVDMAGNRGVLARLHHHYGDNIMCSCGVGITHWESRDGSAPDVLPGAKPTMFFAPSQIQKRLQEWGMERYQASLAEATSAFYGKVDQWVTIEERPFSDVDAVYHDVLRGITPDRGIVIKVS